MKMKCPLQGKTFYCREWVFTKISHYLSQSETEDRNSGILIVGGPGSGKTAVCCELAWPSIVISPQAELNARLVAYHFCQRFHAASLEPVEFIRSIAYQLAESPLIPDFGEKIRSDPGIQFWLDPSRCQWRPRESFRRVILDTLSGLLPPQETLILIVDSLHEIYDQASAATNQVTSGSDQKEDVTILDLVSEAAAGFPSWLMLICTSRRGWRPVTQRLAGFKKMTLDDLRRSYVVRDIQQYILSRLDAEDSLRKQLDSETADMLNQLHIKSAGCLLYLELVMDGVSGGFIRLREIQHMPGTLNGLYLWLCQRMFNRGQSFLGVRNILEVLLAVREPLTLTELEEVLTSHSPLNSVQFHHSIQSLANLLQEIELEICDSGKKKSKCIIIFHPSFSEWLLDVKYCTQKYRCTPSEGHGCIAFWYANRSQDLACEEVVCFAYHLTKCPVKSPFSDTSLSNWLIQSGAPVQDLVLNSPVINQATTRLLLEAGADLANPEPGNLEDGSLTNQEEQKYFGRGNRSPDSEDESVRSENEILADESLVDSEGRTNLHKAAEGGRLGTLRRFLARGAYCDAEDRHGDTPLCLAAKQGHFTLLHSLIQAGANPNHIGHEGWTPLRCAARGGSLETVKELLENGAEVDYTGDDSRTALRAAAWAGHLPVLELLLESGAKVEKADPEGRTALMAAAYMGHRDIVTLLMDWGADPNHADKEGRTGLSVTSVCASSTAQHMEVAECLLNGGADINCRDGCGRTPLYTAALEGHLTMCQLLVGFGADLDLADNSQNSPLLVAASCGHTGIVNILLDHGADPDTIDSEGRTVLSIAAAQGSPEIVGELLDRSLDEMHRDNNGWIPLHHAAFEGNPDACFLLCQRCLATVEQTDREGRHPLILAAEEGHLDTLKVLLGCKAPINQPTLDGCTALRLASINSHKLVCETLIGYGADIETHDIDGTSTLYTLVLNQNLEMAEFFLALGCGREKRDTSGRSPLHVAAWQGDESAVSLLVKWGADINSRDSDGRTPLMMALWRNELRVAKQLLEMKADVDAVCLEGATALSIACQQGQEEAVRLLLRYGADPEHQDTYGRTAVEVAAKAGHSQIVDLVERMNSLSPLSPRRAMNTGNSGGSSDKTSGFVSLLSSSDSQCPATNTPNKHTLPGLNLATIFHQQNISFSTQSSARSDQYGPTSSNKSTLSSCGTPEEDFARQLLERSLPRPHSRPLSMRLVSTEIPLSLSAHEDLVDTSHSSHNESLYESLSIGKKKRPGIATNPKCRKPKNPISTPINDVNSNFSPISTPSEDVSVL